MHLLYAFIIMSVAGIHSVSINDSLTKKTGSVHRSQQMVQEQRMAASVNVHLQQE